MANADTPLSLRGAGAFCNPKASVCLIPHWRKLN